MSNLSRRVAGLVAAGGLALSLAPPASAQGPVAATAEPSAAATPALRAALDAAWQRAAAARAAEALRAQAAADGAAAAAAGPAPPALTLGLRSDRLHRDRGAGEVEVGVALPLWQSGERRARTAVAQAALAQAQAEVAATRLALAGTLRDTAWAALARRAELAAASEHAATLARLADDVERRVRAGESAPADALLAQAEVLAARVQQAEATLRLHEAAGQWRALTGQAEPPHERLAGGRRDAAAADRGPPPAVPAAHPQRQLARLAVEAAQQRLRLAQTTPRAAPELSLGLRRSQAGFGQPHEDSLAVALRLPLGAAPVQALRVAAVQAELDHAEAAERELQARLDAALAVAGHALASARVQVDAEAERARLLHERAALVERAWRAGEAALPELLRALSAAAQADAALARQRAGLGLAEARLQQTLGVQP